MTITDIRPSDEMQELRARVRAFMEEHVYPNEPVLNREDEGTNRPLPKMPPPAAFPVKAGKGEKPAAVRQAKPEKADKPARSSTGP